MKIGIVTDDNSGFPQEISKKLGLYVIPMPIVIDGKDYFENRTITSDEFYKLQAEGHSIHTAQPMIRDFYKIWDEALKENDQILFIGMSSGLTGAIDTAKTLAMDDKYSGKVFVVDNHRISVTLRHSIYDALAMIKEGLSAIPWNTSREAEGSPPPLPPWARSSTSSRSSRSKAESSMPRASSLVPREPAPT